jgi:hypothetical protein
VVWSGHKLEQWQGAGLRQPHLPRDKGHRVTRPPVPAVNRTDRASVPHGVVVMGARFVVFVLLLLVSRVRSAPPCGRPTSETC